MWNPQQEQLKEGRVYFGSQSIMTGRLGEQMWEALSSLVSLSERRRAESGEINNLPRLWQGYPSIPRHGLKPVMGSGKLFSLTAIPSEFKWKYLQMWKVWFQSYIFSKYFIRENKTGKGRCASRKQSTQLLVITSASKHFQLDTVPYV